MRLPQYMWPLVVGVLATVLSAPIDGSVPGLAGPWHAFGAQSVEAQTLRGGKASLDRQNEQARRHDFSFLESAGQVNRFVELGYLVPVVPGQSLELHQVSFPYARPEIRVFLARLSEQYRSACGEKLVVTSLTRPSSNQPRNASTRSVHPTGMAVDLRRSSDPGCRSWLESTLLSLEARGVLEAILERNPPHYHLAVFPQPYIHYVAELTGTDRIDELLDSTPSVEVEWVRHTVRSGETLTLLASRYGASLSRIQAENQIRGSRINVGQVLRIPVYQTVSGPARQVAERNRRDAQVSEGSGSVAGAPSGEPGATEGQTAEPPGAGLESGVSSDPGHSGPAPEDGAGASGTTIHTVVRGESIWSIARQYGVRELAVRRANGLTGSRIVAGQELVIPLSGGSGGPASAGASGVRAVSDDESNGRGESQGSAGAAIEQVAVPMRHEVRPGESLWAIARLYGLSVQDLQEANGLQSGAIHPGQVLEVPTDR